MRWKTGDQSMMRTVIASLAVLALVVGGLAVAPRVEAQDSTFTIAVLPDTQNYLNSAYPGRDHYFSSQVDWVIAEQANRDIVFVSHVGDVVQNSQNETEWNLARPIFDTLHGSGIPFAVAAGNHDMLYDATGPAFSATLPASRFAGDAWFGGSYENNLNSYQVVSHEGNELLFLHIRFLRYASIEGTLDWASQVLEAHPDHLAFVTTHEFAGLDGGVLQTRLRDEVIAPACNVVAVFSGHIHGQSRGSFADDCGRPVPHMLSNYQHEADGGQGFLRIYEVNTAAMSLAATTYSPTFNTYRQDSANQFTVQAAEPGTPPGGGGGGGGGGNGGGEAFAAVPFGTQWKYYDDGAPAAGWNQPGFDDRAWPLGSAEFGFGDGDEATVIDGSDPGGSRITAAYFRTTFDLGQASTQSALIRLLADDGAVVWLNGSRVVNDNMASGPVTYDTLSATGRWGNAERMNRTYGLPADRFVAGMNTVAVEVHQREPSSSDLSFNAEIEVVLGDAAPAPTATAVPSNPTATPIPQSPVGDISVVDPGAAWRYFDQGEAPGAWNLAGFDDTGWSLGNGQFGFGDGDEVTPLTRIVATRGLHTAYFRAAFDIAPGSTVNAALLQLVADDAAVVWVNGQRVLSDNITAGAVDYWTLASSGRWGAAERTLQPFSLPASVFTTGANVVAIEVHQRSEWSSDLSFDATLTLTIS